jgi:hypothetical protein
MKLEIIHLHSCCIASIQAVRTPIRTSWRLEERKEKKGKKELYSK